MNYNWVEDIVDMHRKFGFHEAVKKMDKKQLREFLKLRMNMIEEEVKETREAFQAKNSEEMVDGIIDTIVFCIGTLDLFDVDADRAWQEVMQANFAKNRGVKEGRPNPLGLPDLIKRDDWAAPEHYGNWGLFPKTFGREK